ncbi:amidohydrolase family protein [Zavarzinia sp. CC-PAN008]|uniref:amidohydrolase family protein n=1 Tax=Zavarzinia sp. CC-PAN008 TaxID=3243332 RepID=UPI003F747804
MTAAAPRPISADSHISEPPGCYVDHIEPAWRDKAPRMVRDPRIGDMFVIDGMKTPVPIGLGTAAGKPPEQLKQFGVWEDAIRSSWDGSARAADQDRDGVAAEIIYPTVGMLLCNHPDFDYKHACFQAYNRWLEGYVSAAPDRLFGLGQTALRTVAEGIEDLRRIKAAGFRGVMMPGNPNVEDYDHACYDPFWEAAVDLNLPLSFHILTSRDGAFGMKPRGPKINGFMSIIRGCQDILGTMVFGGVFDRFPQLKVVCVEADAGWAPHYMYRMDHAYKRHRHWMEGETLKKLPSEYFAENIYLTFQDDWVAFKVRNLCNYKRLMWANDFPHSDSTWPWSQEILAEQTKDMNPVERDAILRGNVSELYGLDRAPT